jgi:alpha-tubulin suppressor-like RCC1 family protein
MALFNTTVLPSTPYPNVPYRIYQEWCMGDSLDVINANFNHFDATDIALQTKISTLSASIDALTTAIGTFATVPTGPVTPVGPVTPPTIIPKIVGLIDQNLGGGNTQGNMYIVSDGTMRVVGRSSSGELGIGADTSSTTTPRIPLFEPPLFSGEGIASIVPQGDVTFVTTTFGRLYGAGANSQYQLGLVDNVKRSVFTRIYIEPTVVTDAAAVKSPAFFVKKIEVGSGGNSANIAVFALTDSGDVYVWGRQTEGQTGMPAVAAAVGIANANYIFKPRRVTTISNVKDIVSGGNSAAQTTFFLKNDKTLWITGENSQGSAGIGNSYVAAPHLIPVYGDIRNKILQVTVPGITNNVKAVYCGGESGSIVSWIITDSGKVYGTGYNNVGQAINATSTGNKVSAFTELTHFTTNSDIVEHIVGHCDSAQTTMFALIKTSTPNAYTIKGWGTNNMGTLGINNNTTPILSPTAPTAPWGLDGALVSQVCIAGDNANKATLLLDTKNRLWSTGFGDNGLLGNGRTGSASRRNKFELVSISPGYGTPKIIRATNTSFSGWSNFLVVMDTGKVLGWGYDAASSGQLAVDPSSKPTSIPSFVQLVT